MNSPRIIGRAIRIGGRTIETETKLSAEPFQQFRLQADPTRGAKPDDGTVSIAARAAANRIFEAEMAQEKLRHNQPLWYHMEALTFAAIVESGIDVSRCVATPREAAAAVKKMYDLTTRHPEFQATMQFVTTEINVQLVCAIVAGAKKVEISTDDVFKQAPNADPYIMRHDKSYIPAAMAIIAAGCVASDWRVECPPEGIGDRFTVDVNGSMVDAPPPTALTVGSAISRERKAGNRPK
jgi:hypothetical protein